MIAISAADRKPWWIGPHGPIGSGTVSQRLSAARLSTGAKGLLKTQGIMDFDPRAADAAERLSMSQIDVQRTLQNLDADSRALGESAALARGFASASAERRIPPE